jgi:hypothetical protein
MGPRPRSLSGAPESVLKPEAKVRVDLRAALQRNKVVLATFEAFSPSHRREIVE